VSNEMRRDTLVGKTGAGGYTSLNGLLEQVVDAVSAQGRATSIGEGHRGTISRIAIIDGSNLMAGRKVTSTDVTAEAVPFHRAPPSIAIPDLILVKR
jgi:hypothetical protein